MRLVQALEVAAARHETKRPAVMHQAVMDDEVQQAVCGHARTDPLQRVHALSAQGDQHDGQPGEYHGIQVVLLEPALTWLVVRAVPAPAPAMHHVFVGVISHAFHGGQRGEKNQSVDDHRVTGARALKR